MDRAIIVYPIPANVPTEMLRARNVTALQLTVDVSIFGLDLTGYVKGGVRNEGKGVKGPSTFRGFDFINI